MTPEKTELLKLTKDVLCDKIIELSTAEVGAVIAERDALQAQLDELAATPAPAPGNSAALEAQIAELQSMVDQQAEELRAKAISKGKPTVDIPGAGQHKVNGSIVFDKVKYTAEELANNPEVCVKLLAKGSAILEKV